MSRFVLQARQAMNRLFLQVRPLRRSAVLSNAFFLIANTLSGSFFGFLFWVVAARSYPPAQVGLGAAYISALTLLATISDLGLSSALIRFAPTMGATRIVFINSASTAVVIATLLATALFVLGIPVWSPGMSGLTHVGLPLAIFVASATIFALAQFLDKVFVAFEVTHFMFLRNVLSNIVRLAIIVAAAHLLGAAGLVLSVGGGALAGLLLAAAVFAPAAVAGYRLLPACDWRLLRDRAGYSLGNHVATLVWSVPALIYPLLVVSLLGAGINARFYISWMIANLLFIVPVSISTSAFARASNLDPPEASPSGKTLVTKDTSPSVSVWDAGPFWRTMWLTLAGLLVPSLGLMMGAPLALRVFGHHYSAGGPGLLVLLVLSVFPYTVNTAVITSHRIERNIGRMVYVSGLTILLCLGLSVGLGRMEGVMGVGLGWLAGQVLGIALSLLSRTGSRQSAQMPLPEHRALDSAPLPDRLPTST